MRKIYLSLIPFLLTACMDHSVTPPDLLKQPPMPIVTEWIGFSSGPAESEGLGFIRGMHPLFIQDGWTKYFTEEKIVNGGTWLENFQKFGSHSVAFHLPFGRKDTGDFDFAGLTESAKDPRLKNVVNIDDFVNAMTIVFQKAEMTQMYFYLGYVGAQKEIWSDLDEAGKIKLALINLEPFIRLLNKVKSPKNTHPISIIIDTAAAQVPGDINLSKMIKLIGSLGFNYGGEPWPGNWNPWLSDPSYQYFCIDLSIPMFDPEQNPGAVAWAAYRKDFKGPFFPIMVQRKEGETVEQMAERAKAYVKLYGHVAWADIFGNSITAKDLMP